MKIRKWLALCLAALLALPLAAYAQESEEEESTTLEGYVTEIIDGGFVLEDKQRGQVILNTDESTVWDGVLIDNELEAGMYVLVDFDGRMTRSIPPQAHADRVGCYTLQGVVSEFYESGVLVTGDEIFGDVIVNLELVDSAHVNGPEHARPGDRPRAGCAQPDRYRQRKEGKQLCADHRGRRQLSGADG